MSNCGACDTGAHPWGSCSTQFYVKRYPILEDDVAWRTTTVERDEPRWITRMRKVLAT